MAFLARNKKSRTPKDSPIYAVPYENHAYSSRPPSSMSSAHTPEATRTSFSSPEYHYSRSHRPSMSSNADDNVPQEDMDRARERVGKMAMGADDSDSEASESATLFRHPRTISHKRSMSNRSHLSTTHDSSRNEFGAIHVDPDDAQATIVSAASSKMSMASAWNSSQQRATGSTASINSMPPPRPPSRTDKSISHRPSLTQSVNSFQSRASRSSQHSSYSGFSQPSAPTGHMPTEMPRPPPDAVDRLFRALIEQRQRDNQGPIPIDDMLNWSVDKKWQLVKDNQVGDHRVDIAMKGRSKKDRPEYYLSKFLDGTISVKTIGSLNVGLRTYELPWIHAFVDMQGQSVLGNYLANLNKPGRAMKSEMELQVEYELIKCLKSSLNTQVGADHVIKHNACISNIITSLLSPNIATRKIVTDIMTFLAHYDEPLGHKLVLKALEDLRVSRTDNNRFEAWFNTLELTIDGRGKMGSLVGASEEIRSLRSRERDAMREAVRNGVMDSGLNEYALSTLFLINAILGCDMTIETRIHWRTQMELAGVKRILQKISNFSQPLPEKLAREIDTFHSESEYDREEMLKHYNNGILKDLSDPRDIFQTILDSVQNSRALEFFTSALKHLLLIREGGEIRVRYFQLISQLISTVVLDRTAIESDFSSTLGVSVSALVSRFADQDRLADAEEEIEHYRAVVARLKRDKQALEGEISQRQDGLVGQLKNRLARTEEDLRISRQTCEALEVKMNDETTRLKEKIDEQEVQIRELFNMLKETRALDSIIDESGILDRRELMDVMEKRFHRVKTILRLEGKDAAKKALVQPITQEEKREVELEKTHNLKNETHIQTPTTATSSKSLHVSSTLNSAISPRKSRFEDAEDENVRQLIEESLANEDERPFESHTSTRTPPPNRRQNLTVNTKQLSADEPSARSSPLSSPIRMRKSSLQNSNAQQLVSSSSSPLAHDENHQSLMQDIRQKEVSRTGTNGDSKQYLISGTRRKATSEKQEDSSPNDPAREGVTLDSQNDNKSVTYRTRQKSSRGEYQDNTNQPSTDNIHKRAPHSRSVSHDSYDAERDDDYDEDDDDDSDRITSTTSQKTSSMVTAATSEPSTARESRNSKSLQGFSFDEDLAVERPISSRKAPPPSISVHTEMPPRATSAMTATKLSNRTRRAHSPALAPKLTLNDDLSELQAQTAELLRASFVEDGEIPVEPSSRTDYAPKEKRSLLSKELSMPKDDTKYRNDDINIHNEIFRDQLQVENNVDKPDARPTSSRSFDQPATIKQHTIRKTPSSKSDDGLRTIPNSSTNRGSLLISSADDGLLGSSIEKYGTPPSPADSSPRSSASTPPPSAPLPPRSNGAHAIDIQSMPYPITNESSSIHESASISSSSSTPPPAPPLPQSHVQQNLYQDSKSSSPLPPAPSTKDVDYDSDSSDAPPPAPPLPRSSGQLETFAANSDSDEDSDAPPPAPPLPIRQQSSSFAKSNDEDGTPPPPAPSVPRSYKSNKKDESTVTSPPPPPAPAHMGAKFSSKQGLGMDKSLLDAIKSRNNKVSQSEEEDKRRSVQSLSSPIPPAPPSAGLSSRGAGRFNARKDIVAVAKRQMKQLQWEDVTQKDISKTVWARGWEEEHKWAEDLRSEGIFDEMEADFRAKVAAVNLAAKREARKELKSVIDSHTRQHIEIILLRKKSESANVDDQIKSIIQSIISYDKAFCNEKFLSELKFLLPSSEIQGKLNIYKNADEATLSTLHPADRFIVELIKIYRLEPRIKGMLYRERFDEISQSIENDVTKIREACEALSVDKAVQFHRLLHFILLFGNYLNATGHKGGAFGFRLASINKLVDTKGADNKTTLLHFVERTISSKYPEMRDFLDEISKPAEAYKLSLEENRKEFNELRMELETTKDELENNFVDIEDDPQFDNDGYGAVMWPFVAEAQSIVDGLVDKIRLSDAQFSHVKELFAIDVSRPCTTTHFFGIFKEFSTSYKSAHKDNEALAKEKASRDKRRKASAPRRQSRLLKSEISGNDRTLMDQLFVKLGEGTSRRARNHRRVTSGSSSRSGVSTSSPAQTEMEDPEALARGMLSQLGVEGFEPSMISPPTSPKTPRSRSRRLQAHALETLSEVGNENVGNETIMVGNETIGDETIVIGNDTLISEYDNLTFIDTSSLENTFDVDNVKDVGNDTLRAENVE